MWVLHPFRALCEPRNEDLSRGPDLPQARLRLAPLAGWTRCASASLLRMVGVLRGSAVTQGRGDANSIGFEESNGRDGQI